MGIKKKKKRPATGHKTMLHIQPYYVREEFPMGDPQNIYLSNCKGTSWNQGPSLNIEYLKYIRQEYKDAPLLKVTGLSI